MEKCLQLTQIRPDKSRRQQSATLAREHWPDVNNKPISIPYLEQGYRWNITTPDHNIQFESGILIPIIQSVPDY